MNTQKSPMDHFNEVINQVDKCVPFNPEWNNGTGYLNKATEDSSLALEKGEMARSLSIDTDHPVLNNRRILFIGVGDGTNVVVFERNCDGADGVIVSNTPDHLAGFENKTQSHTSFYPETLGLVIEAVRTLPVMLLDLYLLEDGTVLTDKELKIYNGEHGVTAHYLLHRYHAYYQLKKTRIDKLINANCFHSGSLPDWLVKQS